MKILLTVNFAYNGAPGNEILLVLWDRWASRYKDKLHCDLRFVIGGNNGGYKNVIDQLTKNCHSSIVTTDQSLGNGWLNWPSIVDADGYDFVFRMDHDAFITVDTVNQYCDYIQDNPHIDFFSPSNVIRPVMTVENDLDVRSIIFSPHPKNPEVASYTPWNQIGYNGDLYGIKRAFFLQAIQNYKDDPVCIKHSSWTELVHNTITFEHICNLLKYKNPAITPKMMQSHLIWDGAFGTDIWTHMCAAGMRSAGVGTIDQKSFLFKNSMAYYAQAREFNSWHQVKDSRNILWPREDNIYGATDLFHLENGYLLNWYFDLQRTLPHGQQHITALQSTKQDNHVIWSYCMVNHFVKTSGFSYLQNLFQRGKEILMTNFNVDVDRFLPIEEKLITFYYPVLKEYL